MSDSPITLRLRTPAPLMSLTNQKVSMWYDITHETQKAILLAAVRKVEDMDFEARAYWFPKSQIRINGEVLPGKAVNELARIEAHTIVIPGWLWDKKTPTKGMGCR